jgi:hypothetical protein
MYRCKKTSPTFTDHYKYKCMSARQSKCEQGGEDHQTLVHMKITQPFLLLPPLLFYPLFSLSVFLSCSSGSETFCFKSSYIQDEFPLYHIPFMLLYCPEYRDSWFCQNTGIISWKEPFLLSLPQASCNTLLPWSGRQQVLLKHWYSLITLHDITSQTPVIVIFTVIRIWNVM